MDTNRSKQVVLDLSNMSMTTILERFQLRRHLKDSIISKYFALIFTYEKHYYINIAERVTGKGRWRYQDKLDKDSDPDVVLEATSDGHWTALLVKYVPGEAGTKAEILQRDISKPEVNVKGDTRLLAAMFYGLH